MANVFSVDIPVRFGDCDPAGIVFYPRYFEMFNGVVEDWCARELGLSFREMHLRHGMGLPTVHLETDFTAPSELGETLRAELAVEKIGGASLLVAIRLLGPQGGERVRAKIVLVAMNLRERRAMPIPQPMRERAAAFQAETNKQ
ncbi:MAG TPA: thioesterase family protein [Paucimonas sp.]|nr:thioesterase family protein [Paucimonas sp.]